MVATDRILGSEDQTPRNQHHSEIYSFCACAQVITRTGIQEPGMWEEMARLYHQGIALPASEEHRQIMLSGEPTPKLPELFLFGKTEEND